MAEGVQALAAYHVPKAGGPVVAAGQQEATGVAERKKLRKKDLLAEAERRLASARWLPEPLRTQ